MTGQVQRKIKSGFDEDVIDLDRGVSPSKRQFVPYNDLRKVQAKNAQQIALKARQEFRYNKLRKQLNHAKAGPSNLPWNHKADGTPKTIPISPRQFERQRQN